MTCVVCVHVQFVVVACCFYFLDGGYMLHAAYCERIVDMGRTWAVRWIAMHLSEYR